MVADPVLARHQLEDAGVRLSPGLTDAEVDRLQSRFDVTFGAEHRAFLQECVPTGRGWPAWRSRFHRSLARDLAWPVDGVLFDVDNNGFWAAAWGPRPVDDALAVREARAALASVPRLVPLYGNRYMTAAPTPEPSPVLSLQQTDVVLYGFDLNDYLTHEFAPDAPRAPWIDPAPIPFWSDLAARNADLQRELDAPDDEEPQA